ncbi:MAG: aspartate aminotransferase family protein [Nitrospirae bacterium]|nr:aspartate aminotransferase family protein [Nitrospirota bacterium]
MTDHLKRHISNAWGFAIDMTVTRAQGVYVFDDAGRKYMDFTSGHAVCNIGHNHPAVVEAIKAQADKLIHAGSIFYYEPLLRLMDSLSSIAPPGLDRFFLSNSGAEAVEGAVKLARYHTRRQGIISFTGAFHGRTLGAASLTSSAVKYRARYHPLLPSVYRAFYPYCYRCMLGKHPSTCDIDCLGYLDYLFTHEIAPDEVAAIIIEPVLGEGGYAPAPAAFLERLRYICDDNGIILIFDEVQSGFGRTCKWSALEHYGVKPDIMTLAKGIASGMPLSAVVSTADIMDGWETGAHGTTFGGNPISCAASVATVEAIKREGLLEKSDRLSSGVMTRLFALKRDCDVIGDVRGLGYMIGVEFVKDGDTPNTDAVARLKSRCLERGLIIIECGTYKNTIRFIPPLVTTADQMDEALGIFEEEVRKL